MWTYIEITDAMFFLACGNRPVKLIASVFSDTYYHWSPLFRQHSVFYLTNWYLFNLLPFVATLELACDHAQFSF